MRAEGYEEKRLEAEGWPLRLTSYKLGEVFHCQADNVSPGATLARATGASREEAERKALEAARKRLGRTRRHQVESEGSLEQRHRDAEGDQREHRQIQQVGPDRRQPGFFEQQQLEPADRVSKGIRLRDNA